MSWAGERIDVMRAHSIEIIDRGGEHIHRWTTSCSCGWKGVHRRRKGDAVKVWRDHCATPRRNQRRSTSWGPRPPTPQHLLPESLRRLPGGAVASDPMTPAQTL